MENWYFRILKKRQKNQKEKLKYFRNRNFFEYSELVERKSTLLLYNVKCTAVSQKREKEDLTKDQLLCASEE